MTFLKVLAIIQVIAIHCDTAAAFIERIEDQSNDTVIRLCCYGNGTSDLVWYINDREVRCPPQSPQQFFIIPCIGLIYDNAPSGSNQLSESCRAFNANHVDMTSVLTAECCEGIDTNSQCESIDVELQSSTAQATVASTANPDPITSENGRDVAIAAIVISVIFTSIFGVITVVVLLLHIKLNYELRNSYMKKETLESTYATKNTLTSEYYQKDDIDQKLSSHDSKFKSLEQILRNNYATKQELNKYALSSELNKKFALKYHSHST